MTKRSNGLAQARKWGCEPPIYKNLSWRLMSRHERKALLDDLTVVSVLQEVITEVEWICIAEERSWW